VAQKIQTLFIDDIEVAQQRDLPGRRHAADQRAQGSNRR
jgi:hypothetical protein